MFYVRVNVCLILYWLDLTRQVNFLDETKTSKFSRTRLRKPTLADRHIFRSFRDVDICSNCLIMLGCIITTKKNLFVLLPHSHFVNVWSISTAPSYFNPSHFIKVWNFCQTFSILHCPWIVSTIVRIKPWGVRNDNIVSDWSKLFVIFWDIHMLLLPLKQQKQFAVRMKIVVYD